MHRSVVFPDVNRLRPEYGIQLRLEALLFAADLHPTDAHDMVAKAKEIEAYILADTGQKAP